MGFFRKLFVKEEKPVTTASPKSKKSEGKSTSKSPVKPKTRKPVVYPPATLLRMDINRSARYVVTEMDIPADFRLRLYARLSEIDFSSLDQESKTKIIKEIMYIIECFQNHKNIYSEWFINLVNSLPDDLQDRLVFEIGSLQYVNEFQLKAVSALSSPRAKEFVEEYWRRRYVGEKVSNSERWGEIQSALLDLPISEQKSAEMAINIDGRDSYEDPRIPVITHQTLDGMTYRISIENRKQAFIKVRRKRFEHAALKIAVPYLVYRYYSDESQILYTRFFTITRVGENEYLYAETIWEHYAVD